MWKLLGADYTCVEPEEYNEFSSKKKAMAAYREQAAICKKGSVYAYRLDGKDGKMFCYPKDEWYALWIEEFDDEPEDKFHLVSLDGNYCSYMATVYNPRRQYWKDLFFEGYPKKDVIYKLRHEDNVTVSHEFC